MNIAVAGSLPAKLKDINIIPSIKYKTWMVRNKDYSPNYMVKYLDIKWLGISVGFSNEKD